MEQRGISEISSTIVWETDSQVQVFLQATESQFHRFVFYRTLQSLWNIWFFFTWLYLVYISLPHLLLPPHSVPTEALRRSNLALRQRCEEMEGWQRRTKEEREFLSCRFQEARSLVERLAQENHSLQSMVNGPGSSNTSSNHCCSSSQTENPQLRTARNGPVDGPQVG